VAEYFDRTERGLVEVHCSSPVPDRELRLDVALPDGVFTIHR
jgi:hypothetical protein